MNPNNSHGYETNHDPQQHSTWQQQQYNLKFMQPQSVGMPPADTFMSRTMVNNTMQHQPTTQQPPQMSATASSPFNPWSNVPKKTSLKLRPPINEDDAMKGYFFIQPQAIAVMKKYFFDNCKSYKDVIAMCEEQARFQYYFTVKNFSFAKKHYKRKPAELRSGRGFNCNACDEYFYERDHLTIHNDTNRHKEIWHLLYMFKTFGMEWFTCKKEPNYTINAALVEAERSGIGVNTTQPSNREQQQQFADKAKLSEVPLTNEIFIGLDPLKMSEDNFILATYDNLMEVHWPKPITPYTCRCCNFMSFDTKEELEEHVKTANHVRYEMNYNEAWCVTCQCHKGTKVGLEKHKQSPRHLMIKKLLADSRARAIAYWRNAIDEKARKFRIGVKRPHENDESLSWRHRQDFPPPHVERIVDPYVPKRTYSDSHRNLLLGNPDWDTGPTGPLYRSPPYVADHPRPVMNDRRPPTMDIRPSPFMDDRPASIDVPLHWTDDRLSHQRPLVNDRPLHLTDDLSPRRMEDRFLHWRSARSLHWRDEPLPRRRDVPLLRLMEDCPPHWTQLRPSPLMDDYPLPPVRDMNPPPLMGDDEFELNPRQGWR